jgi:membrane protease YdiL (CAAX protease family)
MDVFLFVAILLLYIWGVAPTADAPWELVFPVAAIAVATSPLLLRSERWRGIGLRVDNLPQALALYLVMSLTFAGLVLLAHRGWLQAPAVEWRHLAGVPGKLGWAFLQQFCLLGFLLPRLCELSGRPRSAAVVAAAVFALFHLPNPFLTLVTLGGGLMLCWLYLRVPNLIAAAVAHAIASTLVSTMLPRVITGGMKVGPGYWW